MATTNPTVTGAWTLPVASQTLYVAVGAVDDSDSDSDPEAPPTDLLGHALAPGQIGDPGGDVWVVALDAGGEAVFAVAFL